MYGKTGIIFISIRRIGSNVTSIILTRITVSTVSSTGPASRHRFKLCAPARLSDVSICRNLWLDCLSHVAINCRLEVRHLPPRLAMIFTLRSSRYETSPVLETRASSRFILYVLPQNRVAIDKD